MTDRELMQQALDSLEGYARNCRCEGNGGLCDAGKALRTRLAQPEPTKIHDCPRCHCHFIDDGEILSQSDGKSWREWQGLTEEEIREFELWLDDEEEKHGWNAPADIVEYLEAKLKEKNGG